MIKLKILADNHVRRRGILGEHGLSILVEIDGFMVLFDTGQSDVFLLNAEHDGIDLSMVDALVVSHGHYDHAGGVPDFCRINNSALIYIHPEAFCERYNAVQGKPSGDCIGLSWGCDGKDFYRSRISFVKKPVSINKNILLSGEVPIFLSSSSYSFVKKDSKGDFKADRVIDEQFMIVKGSKGIYIFAGCSHYGVLNCIEYAKKLFPDTGICGVIGGMHLEKLTNSQLVQFSDNLQSMGIKSIIPMHCTGIMASSFLKNKFGDKCFLVNSGDGHILEY